MPFFQQKNVASDQVVFLYAYERLEAVVDLNRNGVPDPGEREPVINITKSGSLVYAAIGGGSTYKPYIEVKGDIGPLWILARRPLLASYFIYGSKGFYGAYNMPPPGIRFTIPLMPGNLYITPATPQGASVTLGNGSVYKLQPGDYLVTTIGDTGLEIESDKPVAVVLVNLDRGNRASFMTEIVPTTPSYSINWDQPVPFPEAYLQLVENSRVELESHVYIVNTKGVIDQKSTIEYGRVYTPSSVKWLRGRGAPGHISIQLNAVYTIVVARHKATGKVWGATAVAVYNVRSYYESLWKDKYGDIFMVTSLSIYGRSRLVLAEVLGRATINAALKGTTVDLVIPVYNPRAPGLLLSKDVARVNIIEAGPMPTVYILTRTSLQGMMARNVAIPIPASVYRESWPGASGPLRSPGNIVYGPQQADADLDVTAVALMSKNMEKKGVEVYIEAKYKQPGAQCNNTAIAMAVLNPYLDTIYSVSRRESGCSLQIQSEIGDRHESPPAFYIALARASEVFTLVRGGVIEYGSPSDKDFITTNTSQGLRIVETYKDEEGAHPGTVLATIAERGKLYYTRPLTLPQDLGRVLSKHLDLNLEIEIPLTGEGRGEEATTTTATQTRTTTTKESTTGETMTTKTTATPATEEVTTMTGTTETAVGAPQGGEGTSTPTEAEETGAGLGGAYPLRIGDRLEYKIQVKASGPEGTVKGDGILALEVADIRDGDVELVVASNTLPRDAAQTALLGITISDLLTIASMSQGDRRYSRYHGGFTLGVCPLIGGEGIVEGEEEITVGITGRYRCMYKEGILTGLEVRISGEYGGQEINAEIRANLIGGTVEGVEGAPGPGTWVDSGVALAIAAVVIVVLAVLLLARRR